METIEDHIKSAQYMMRGTAQLLDDYDEHNEQGRRYLLESALHNSQTIYQRLFIASKTAEKAGRDDNGN